MKVNSGIVNGVIGSLGLVATQANHSSEFHVPKYA